MDVRFALACRRCGHKWDARIKVPKVCPKCKTYFWTEKWTDVDGRKRRVKAVKA